jgi:hypothetical protein
VLAIDLTTLPESCVPAAFDRGHLYSPTSDYITPALRGRCDYRPGALYEPMPPPPRGDSKAFAWWARNIARVDVPDFLGLRIGDEVTIQHVTTVGRGEVVKTYRSGAVVRYPMPDGARKPYDEMTVSRRNGAGHWCP